MLYASKYKIYNQSCFDVNGVYYYGVEELPNRLLISDTSFPGEKSMSLAVPKHQRFGIDESNAMSRVSKRYPDVKLSYKVNRNLIDFYNGYPDSELGDNFMTRWAIHADTPMDSLVSASIYPQLKKQLADKSELQAVNMLLNLVQTGFEYEYDEKLWGHDRAFFAEESLFYPYCDCEDRAILLTRLVRDLLGLDCLLVYYPGHLACAIALSDSNAPGDYVNLYGKKFTIADPTYINAPAGYTMPGMETSKARVILLN